MIPEGIVERNCLTVESSRGGNTYENGGAKSTKKQILNTATQSVNVINNFQGRN